MQNECLSWKLKCPNCGFEFGILFDADETEENKKTIRSCPCGCEMDIIKEDVYGKEE